jgi:hypothetical protein
MPSGGGKRSGYSIPGEDTVREAVLDIMDGNVTIRSQRRFIGLVLSWLKGRNRDYRLSAERLRRIAARMDEIDMIIHCRESGKAYRGSRCLVCGSAMDSIKNATLYGWTVSTGKICQTCGYWTGVKKRVPIRYVFTTEKESYLNGESGERG